MTVQPLVLDERDWVTNEGPVPVDVFCRPVPAPPPADPATGWPLWFWPALVLTVGLVLIAMYLGLCLSHTIAGALL